MLRVLPFAAADFAMLARRPTTELELSSQGMDAAQAGRMYEQSGPCFTFWLEDEKGKRPMLVGGAIVSHPGHATVWAALARDAQPHAIWITKRVRQFVAGLDHARVDAFVAADNPAAIGWAKLCGFAEEARLRRFYPDGGDCAVMTCMEDC